ncbi:MAG: long-chain acyl-CoA synthetase, partial [Pseudonocardiales bacterium]|nr:long-chain acyl-CoA synthetase [Pseudonocardiales bacterium]
MSDQADTAPWRELYPPDVDPDLAAPDTSTLAMFLATVEREPHATALHYFGRAVSRGELADLAARIAAVLRARGVRAGDRVGLCLQNTPLFPATLLATWGVGAIVVPINPMLRPDELTPMLADSGVATLVAHPAMADVITETRARLDSPLTVLWSDPTELAGGVPVPF